MFQFQLPSSLMIGYRGILFKIHLETKGYQSFTNDRLISGSVIEKGRPPSEPPAGTKMFKYLCLLALLGSALGYQPGNKYTYAYSGRMGMGIPEIRNKVTAIGITATVEINVKEHNVAIVQFVDVKVGEYLGDVDCELRDPVPMQYSPVSGYALHLEEPFEVHLQNDEKNVMIVPKSDEEWLTNLRKSVAAMFLLAPLRGDALRENLKQDRSSRSDEQNPSFVVVEPTLFGKCTCEYTMIPVSSHSELTEDESYMKNKEEEVSMTEREDSEDEKYYRLVKTINFDKCEQRVELFRAGLSNISMITRSQFGDIMSRSSVSSYILKGRPGTYVIQTGRVEGHVTANPLGVRGDKLMSISNQTLVLTSTDKAEKSVRKEGPTKVIDTWFMEFASPFAPPSSKRVPWINYYSKQGAKYLPLLPENVATGVQLSDELIQKFASRLDSVIKDVADRLVKVGEAPKGKKISPWNTNEAEIVSDLDDGARIVRGIDVQRLQRLFDQYHGDSSPKGQLHKLLLIEIAAAGGYGAPIKMLLDNIQHKKISSERIISMFFSLTNHFTAVPLISDLMHYVKSLDLKDDPFLTSMVWMNFAKTLNRVCIDKMFATYTTPLHVFGREQCNRDQVFEDMMDFLKQKLESSSQSWEQMVVVQTMGNLGSQKTLDTLREVIYNEKYEINVRRTAIFALTEGKQEPKAREEVFDILMPIMENREEHTYLRQVATATLLTWRPIPSWWQRLAIRSWKENSNNMAAFTYQLIKEYAHTTDPYYNREARIAQFLVHVTKPYAPTFKYTFEYFRGLHDQREYQSTDYDTRIIRDENNSDPVEIMEYIYNDMGGVKFGLLSASIFGNIHPENALKIASSLRGSKQLEEYVRRSAPHRREEERRHDYSSEEERQHRYPRRASRKSDYRSDMSQYNVFLTAFNNLQYFAPVNEETVQIAFRQGVSELMKKWSSGQKVHLTKFFDPSSLEILIPSEIGVAFLARFNSPVIIGGEGTTHLRVKGKSSPTMSDIFEQQNVTVDFEGQFKLASKLISTFRGLAPWSGKLIASGVDEFKSLVLPGRVAASYVSHENDVHNVTFAFTPSARSEYPAVHIHTVPCVVRKSIWPGEKHTEYEKFETIAVRDDGRGVTQRTIPLSKRFLGIDGHISFEGDKPYPYTLGNVIDYFRNPPLFNKLLTSPTVRLGSTVLAVNFGNSETKTLHASVAATSPLSEEKTTTFLANALFEGNPSRYYEFHLENKEEETKEKSELSASLTRNAIPKYHLDSAAYCYHMITTSPDINDFEKLLNHLTNGQMTVKYDGTLKGGKSCNEQQYASIKGELDLSEERKRRLAKELEDDCNYDPINPMVSFRTSPVYDKLAIRVDYKENIPKFLKNVTYQAYDAARGLTYPHIYFDYLDVKNQPNRINVRGERNIEEGSWIIRGEMPTENARLDRFRFPFGYDHIIPMSGIHTHYSNKVYSRSSKILMETQASDQCVLTKSRVRTFDGYRYSYSPEACPTISVMQRDDPKDVLLRTDKSDDGNMECQLGQVKTGTTVTFNTRSFNVNGDEIKLSPSKKEIKTFNDKFFAEARKVKDCVEVSVPGNFTVKLCDDRIEIEPSRRLRAKLAGLCGDFNGETEKELVGPKNCLYKSPAMFTKAWTEYEGVGCDWHRFEDEKSEVENYQKKCSKVRRGSSGKMDEVLAKLSKQEEGKDCTEYIYLIKTRGGMVCVSQQSIGTCMKGCKLEKEMIVRDVYDCWPEDQCPDALQENLKRGYVRDKVDMTPSVTTSFRTSHALICDKN